MLKKVFVLFFLVCLAKLGNAAQADSLQQAVPLPKVKRYAARDSAALARWQAKKDSIKNVQDSLKAIGDSLSMVYLIAPGPNRPNYFLDSLIDVYEVKNLNFNEWAAKFPKKVQRYDTGRSRRKGELWVVAFLLLLLILFALLKNFFSKESLAIIQAFYSNRILNQINKEEKFFNSWPFVFLYILFGFTMGMLLYQCCKYFQLSDFSGFDSFVRLSVIVIAGYTLKVLIVGLLGFLFGAGKIAKEYVSVLFLSYFNAGLVFFPLVIGFSLTPGRFASVYIYLSLLLLAGIYIFQFIRSITNILSGHKFPKLYLILYLCALEICPLLILAKALRF